ncbi:MULTISPECIES: tetrahydrofolate dehydrogenase/cyclohydrolase catalytic domain-containing protein [Streptomyces]|uniref:tetrahydrofolate dehydrogenase/cyclohydrolase catalytic domain-containing protein n=1 Tax=Streptomyces TaxID=1883 RepID=UPI0007C538C7|nr:MULTISPECIES: tetrahydrofolate dehydrogenase/cyclohydrolase catalytic domain-containing protein [Streptomyces]MDP9951455.1 methylenetetrahydrofolate dehydrogenase (NADP+)/methenyltetrahydrofolate cyclohydrolase [Streptomyces sp. DSM 41269]
MTELVSGRDVLRQARELYAHYRPAVQPTGMKVAVIRFTPAATDPPDWRVRLEASRISAEQKIKSFEHLGFRADHVVLPPGVGRGEFREVLEGYNADPATRAIIVQFPPPRDLAPVVDGMDPAKDIDALLKGRSPYPACATAEGIYRVAEPFATDRPAIAVVGSKGFVGQGVVTMLRADGHDPMTLDHGDRLERVRDADIVISVTGSPGILTPDHIQPHHRVVIDSGFVPQADGSVRGDVRAEAYGIPQNLTPVPGGIGPVEMATLMERVVRQEVDPDVVSWKVTPGPYLERARFTTDRTAAATAVTTAAVPSIAAAARLRGAAGPAAGAPPTSAQPTAAPRGPAHQTGPRPQLPPQGGGGPSR